MFLKERVNVTELCVVGYPSLHFNFSVFVRKAITDPQFLGFITFRGRYKKVNRKLQKE